MGKEIKPKYGTNKTSIKYSDDNIKLFLESILYFDKLIFDRDCVYKLEYYDKKLYSYEFYNLYDAIRFLLAYRESFIYCSGALELFISFKDDTVFDINEVREATDKDILAVKYYFERHAGSCIVLFSKDFSQIYTVNYYSDNDFSGYAFSYDMKYLYDKDNCIELKPYTAYTTDLDFGDVYVYGKKRTKVKIPWFITDKELTEGDKLLYKYNCSGYGIGGSFQISNPNGCIYSDDSQSSPHHMMPMAAIHPCENKRPPIKGITRYKFIVKFPNGDEFPHYVECKTGDMGKAIDLLTKYDWACPEICDNPRNYIKSIKAVPEGEWF